MKNEKFNEGGASFARVRSSCAARHRGFALVLPFW